MPNLNLLSKHIILDHLRAKSYYRWRSESIAEGGLGSLVILHVGEGKEKIRDEGVGPLWSLEGDE